VTLISRKNIFRSFMVTEFLWKLQLPVCTFVKLPLLRIITRRERLASYLTLLTRCIVAGVMVHLRSLEFTEPFGGWTVIQRRKDGSENFHRPWSDYEKGVRDLNGEFWYRLKTINC